MYTKSLVIFVLLIAIASIGGLFWVKFTQTKTAVVSDLPVGQVTLVVPIENTATTETPLAPIEVVPVEQTFTVLGTMTMKVNTTAIALYDKEGKLLVQNPTGARLADTSTRCPSEGFMNITSTATVVTIEQQTCSGWDRMNETATLEMKAGILTLTGFKVAYIDTRTPNAPARIRTLTPLQFGTVTFKDMNSDALYQYLR